MKGIRMQGGIPLQGKVRIQGSKNAVLPILAATLLTNEVSYIQNCPRIADVHCFVPCLLNMYFSTALLTGSCAPHSIPVRSPTVKTVPKNLRN